jgi:hypothetical protein
MTPSLERFSELVRQAEARSRSKKLEGETRHAAEKLREVELHARQAARRLRDERPGWLRKLEQAEVDEQQLRELTKKLAQYKAALEPDSNPEGLIDSARGEIDSLRRTAKAALEVLGREADEARKLLRGVMDQYQQHRRELDRLQPKLAEAFATEDRLLWDAEMHFPGGLLHALAREVEAGAPFFGMLSRHEQYAQLKIWIGRYRQFQDDGDPEADPNAPPDPEAAEAAQVQAQRVFHTLKGLSKQYEPGYIDAFRLDFAADWPAYVAEAQAQLQQAVEMAKQSRDRTPPPRVEAAQPATPPAVREAGRAALAGLKALVARGSLPAEGLDEFLDLLRQAVRGLGPADPELVSLALPLRDQVDGDDLRPLRANLDRVLREVTARDDGEPATFARFDDVMPVTRGRRALMVGGAVREDARRALQSLFGFDRLEWEAHDETRPATLELIEQRVHGHGIDLMLVLKGGVGPGVPDRLRMACQQSGVDCVVVDRGYAPAQIGEALRRLLPRSA